MKRFFTAVKNFLIEWGEYKARRAMLHRLY